MDEFTVKISRAGYEKLIETEVKCELLIEALFANVKFNYINENLDFYVSSDMIKAILLRDYNRNLEALTKAYEEEHEKCRSEASNV